MRFLVVRVVKVVNAPYGRYVVKVKCLVCLSLVACLLKKLMTLTT